MAVFADFNIHWVKDDSIPDDRICRAVDYGYETIAINNFVQELSVKTGKKETNKAEEIKSPSQLLDGAITALQGRSASVLTRFSTVLSDSAQVIRLQKDPVIQSYNLLSVQPKTEKLFLSACKDLEIDIISLDFTSRLPFPLKHTAVGCAMNRGVHFEIIYSPILRDSNSIKNMIYNTSWLLDSCRGKNLIISSGCRKNTELQSPYCVMSIGSMLGLSETQAKAAISINCRDLLYHAAARKSAKGVLSIVKASTLSPGEQWKIPVETPQLEEDLGENDLSEDKVPSSKKIKLDAN